MSTEPNAERLATLAASLKKLEVAFRKETASNRVMRMALDQLSHDFYVERSQRNISNGRELTEQEKFWSGAGGTSYSHSNFAGEEATTGKINLWQTIFGNIDEVTDALEIGCNVGLNLRAIHHFVPEVALAAVEINPRAASIMRSLGYVELYEASIFDFDVDRQWELVFIRGVLMHLNTAMLPQAYAVVDKHAARYACFVENFSEAPETVIYKGRDDLLVSRHFAREFCERYPHWTIIAEGWDSQNEKAPSNRDVKWFVMQRA